jgi:alpha-ribazole phosphatase
MWLLASAPIQELLLIRHAPALNEGRLAGRRDVPADIADEAP